MCVLNKILLPIIRQSIGLRPASFVGAVAAVYRWGGDSEIFTEVFFFLSTITGGCLTPQIIFF